MAFTLSRNFRSLPYVFSPLFWDTLLSLFYV